MHRSRSSVAGVLLATVALGAGSLGAAAAGLQEGKPDLTFGGDGAVTTAISTQSPLIDYGYATAVLTDGRILVGGSSHSTVGGGQDFTIARYKPGGALDTTFGDGDDGVTTTDLGSANDIGASLALQPDGKALVAGLTYVGTTYSQFAVARYRTDGSLDPDFGDAGVVVTDWGDDAAADAVVVDKLGRILVGGYRTLGTDVNTYVFAIARYTAGGDPDLTFGDGGFMTAEAIGTDDEIFELALQTDGRILAGGFSKAEGVSSFALCRYDDDGNPDPGFGPGDSGCVTTPMGSQDGIEGLAVQSNGKIVAAGYMDDGTNTSAAVRYLPGGALDDSFAGDGIRKLTIPPVTGLALQRDGKAVLATSVAGSPAKIAAARLNTNGTSDSGFGTGGVASLTVGDGDSYNEGVAVGRNGKIVVVGSAAVTTHRDFAVGRFIGDAHPPTQARVTGLPRWSLKPVNAFGLAARDDNTGVRAFDIRRRTAPATSGSYGSWKTVTKATTARKGTLTAAAGGTFCLSTRGRDWAGNVGAWGNPSCVALPVDDVSLAKAGSWTGVTGSAYYLGTARRSTDRGATLSLAGADYRHLALVATKCPGCGTVKVFRGSTLLAKVPLGSASTHNHVVIPIDGAAKVRSGTIRVKAVSGGNKPVVIDGLGISLG